MSVQFDLFLHSADVVAESELREALLERRASAAQQKLKELKARNSDHRVLQPACAMIDALQAPPPHDPNTALEHLERLEVVWSPAAKTLFGVDKGRDLLAPLWRAAGVALDGIRFDPDHPDHHASRAYLMYEDWTAVLRVIETEQDYEHQPVLLERMAQALWQLNRTVEAFEIWFTLCWLAPAYFERMIRTERIPASVLAEYWNQAMDAEIEPELSIEWYPAWVLLHEPGLAKSITRRAPAADPERAFHLIKELLSGKGEQLASRRELRDIHPGLFDYYLHHRRQLLDVVP